MLNFCDFIQVFVFTRNHHLNGISFGNKEYIQERKQQLRITDSIFLACF